MDVTQFPEYTEGIAWAAENLDRLRERYSGVNLQTQEIRDILFGAAQQLYPEERDSMVNDLKATAFVAGALKPLAETMEFSSSGMSGIMEMAMEMGNIFGAEAAKHEALEEIKRKPNAWWYKKRGDASPRDLMERMFRRWWKEVGDPENRRKTSRAEVLKHGFGSREMRAFSTLKNITLEGAGGRYVYFDVDGEEGGFQMMAEDAVHPGGIVSQRVGEIVG
jgi:hypothetical protein